MSRGIDDKRINTIYLQTDIWTEFMGQVCLKFVNNKYKYMVNLYLDNTKQAYML